MDRPYHIDILIALVLLCSASTGQYWNGYQPPNLDQIQADVDTAIHSSAPSYEFIQHTIKEVEDYLYPMDEAQAEEALMHLMGDDGDQLLQEIIDDEINRYDRFLWKKVDGVVTIPYVIENSVADNTELIERAMSQYNNLTCIKFVPRTNEYDYLSISDGTACITDVGYKGGMQHMRLGSGCFYVGTLVHELGHTIGFYHEHQRPDRDKYITVLEQNVADGKQRNFDVVWGRGENMITDFDMHSIMIYGKNAFAKDSSQDTMEPKSGSDEISNPYDKPGLTDKDVARVRKLYRCDA